MHTTLVSLSEACCCEIRRSRNLLSSCAEESRADSGTSRRRWWEGSSGGGSDRKEEAGACGWTGERWVLLFPVKRETKQRKEKKNRGVSRSVGGEKKIAQKEWGESLDSEIAAGQRRAAQSQQSSAEPWTERRWAWRKRKCARQERNLKLLLFRRRERERRTDGQRTEYTDEAASGAASHGPNYSDGQGRSSWATSTRSYHCRARGQRSEVRGQGQRWWIESCRRKLALSIRAGKSCSSSQQQKEQWWMFVRWNIWFIIIFIFFCRNTVSNFWHKKIALRTINQKYHTIMTIYSVHLFVLN